MAKNYSYPRVTMSTLAKKHSHNVVNVPDTTIMFAPLVTEKGPDDRVVKVHTLSEFIEIFGSFNEEFYELNGQMALNVYNWLSNGGTLMVKRLKSASAETASFNPGEIPAGDITNTVNVEVLASKKVSRTGDLVAVKVDEGYIILNIGSVEASSTTEVNLSTIEIDYSGFSGTAYSIVKKEGTTIYGITKKSPSTEGFDFDKDCIKVLSMTISSSSASSFTLNAKYHGEYYNSISLECEEITSHDADVVYYNFYVKTEDSKTKKEVVLEKFLQKKKETYQAALSNSSFIKLTDNSFDKLFTKGQHNFDGVTEVNPKTEKCIHKFELSGGTNSAVEYDDTLELIETFWTVSSANTDDAYDHLANRMETPIDIIFDAGYTNEIKNLILSFVRNDSEESQRPDIVFIIDAVTLEQKLETPDEDTPFYLYDAAWSSGSTRPTNVAIYEQYYTILDSVFTSQQIYVAPSYFLTKLIAYNDLTYGLQYPTAGLRRGILDDALWISKNPDPDTKENWFAQRVNYVEKSAREYAFMSQRTFDGSSDMDYTALSFLNNERVLERMKKDLETIGRSYLHEFNDAITIANMSNALNKYVSNWISNRTLSMGVVEVVQDEVSENALDINLNIRFTNTIEVINVSIVIE